MKGANECAPKRCQCGRKLDKPRYGYPWLNLANTKQFGFDWVDYQAPITRKVWHIKCQCTIVYVWSWHETSNGCWRIRHREPLLDSNEIVSVA